MEQILKNSSTLTPAQRAEYREHLMPALRHEGGFLLKGGHGIYLEAMDGKEYMDFTSEQFTCILGLGNEEIAQESMSRQNALQLSPRCIRPTCDTGLSTGSRKLRPSTLTVCPSQSAAVRLSNPR